MTELGVSTRARSFEGSLSAARCSRRFRLEIRTGREPCRRSSLGSLSSLRTESGPPRNEGCLVASLSIRTPLGGLALQCLDFTSLGLTANLDQAELRQGAIGPDSGCAASARYGAGSRFATVVSAAGGIAVADASQAGQVRFRHRSFSGHGGSLGRNGTAQSHASCGFSYKHSLQKLLLRLSPEDVFFVSFEILHTELEHAEPDGGRGWWAMQRQACSQVSGACPPEDVCTVSDSDDPADAVFPAGAAGVLDRGVLRDNVKGDLCILLEDSPKTMAAKRGSSTCPVSQALPFYGWLHVQCACSASVTAVFGLLQPRISCSA